MHTSRLATLLLIVLSVHSRSHASQNQQDEGYYHVSIRDTSKKLAENVQVYIQTSTPLSKICTYLEKENHKTQVQITVYKNDPQPKETHNYTFELPHSKSFSNKISFKDLLEKHLSFDNTKKTIKKTDRRTITNYPGTFQKNPINASSNNATLTPKFESYNVTKLVESIDTRLNFGSAAIVFTKNPAKNDIDIINMRSRDDISKLKNIVYPAQAKRRQAPINILKKKSPNNNILNMPGSNFSSKVSISPPSVSTDSQNQQEEGYYKVRIKCSAPKDSQNMPAYNYAYIQQSTPLSKIHTYLKKHSYLTQKVMLAKYITHGQITEVHQYTFEVPSQSSFLNNISFKELLEKYAYIQSQTKENPKYSISERVVTNYVVKFNILPDASKNAALPMQQLHKPKQFLKDIETLVSASIKTIVFTKNPANNDIDIMEVSSKNDIPKLKNTVFPAQTKPAKAPINILNNNLNIFKNNNNNKQTKVPLKRDNPKKKPLKDNKDISPLPKNDPLSKTNGTSLNSPKNNINILNNNNLNSNDANIINTTDTSQNSNFNIFKNDSDTSLSTSSDENLNNKPTNKDNKDISPLPKNDPLSKTNGTSLNSPKDNSNILNNNNLNGNDANIINTTDTSQNSNFNIFKNDSNTSLSTSSDENLNNKPTNKDNKDISSLPKNDPLSKTNGTSLNSPKNNSNILNNNNLNGNDANIINTTDRSQNSNFNIFKNDKDRTKAPLKRVKPKKKPLKDNKDISSLPKNDPLSKTNGTSLNSPKNNTQNIVNNNNNNASNQAGTYILVVFGLTVCAGIVYAILQKSPTSKSHKPNQDTPQQTS